MSILPTKAVSTESELTGGTDYNVILSSATGKWYSSSAYTTRFVPIPTGVYEVKITSIETYGAIIAFLKTDAHSNNTVPDYATGYEYRIVIASGKTQAFDIPDDCHYVAIFKTNNGSDVYPSSVLKDSYKTIPDVDKTLSISGDAAEAKATGDYIDDTNNQLINSLTESTKIQFISGYCIYTNTSPVDYLHPTVASTWSYAVTEAQEGDTFTITGAGGLDVRLYAFIDSSNNILETAESSAVYDNVTIVAPPSSSKLIINAGHSHLYCAWVGETVRTDILEINHNIDYISSTLPDTKEVQLIHGYALQTDTTYLAPDRLVAGNWCYAIVDVNPGMYVSITGKGGQYPRLWAWVDSNDKYLNQSNDTSSSTQLEDAILFVPSNARKLVCNFDERYPYHLSLGVTTRIELKENSKYQNDVIGCALVQKWNYNTRIKTTNSTVSLIEEIYQDFASLVIDVLPGDKYTIWGSGGQNHYLYCFIDDNGNKYGSLRSSSEPVVITVPNSATKLVCNVIVYYDYALYKGVIPSLQMNMNRFNNWSGKVISTFGDSITWYDGQEFRPAHSEYGQIAVGYQEELRQVGMTVVNNGESGYKMVEILNKIRNTNLASYDAITITCGANDFRYTSQEAIGSVQAIGSTFDETTMCGAMQAAIEYILNQKPTIRIIIITPVRGYAGYSGETVMPQQYPDSMKEIAKLYALPVCDWYYDSGINTLNKTTYLGDDASQTGYYLHPTQAGFRRMGELLRGLFLTI